MTKPLMSPLLITAACGILRLGVASAWAQTPSPPAAFEVASVKQLDESVRPGRPDISFVGTSGNPFKISGNRVSVQGTLQALIADAYGVKDYQISGAPSWVGALRFAIAAESPGDAVPTPDQVRPMLQSLLADRFQLKLHRDTKELPVYHLNKVKTSRLFKPAEPGETFSWSLTPGPGGTIRSKATRESIGDFVRLVGVSADRPVIDKTGITGDIDYDILIQPSGSTPDDVNRAILYAVIDQLGLKLESAKDSIELLVIDRAEKPSAN